MNDSTPYNLATEGFSNLTLVLSAWSGAVKTGDPGPIADILDEEVVWEGRYPGQICRTPTEVLGFLRNGLAQGRRVTRLEARQEGDRVFMIAHGPDFEDVRPDGSRTPRPTAGLIFTLRDGRIVHMKGTD